jgi:hypothetical protein
MTPEPNSFNKKWSKKRIILTSLGVFVSLGVFFVYQNFNKLISAALRKAFEASLVSEVYELTFENLRVDPIGGNISVFNVTFLPKENPDYPYINSYLKLTTKSLKLEDVDIMLLLQSNKLVLRKISITKPELTLDVNSANPTLFPFNPSPASAKAGKSKSLDSYSLTEFELKDAAFEMINSVKKWHFNVQNFNLSLRELQVDQNPGEDLVFLKQIAVSLEKFSGSMEDDGFRQMGFSDLKIRFDSVDIQKNLDTLIFQFRDFNAGVEALDLETADSLFRINMDAFDMGYLDGLITLRGMRFTPNVSNREIQKNYRFQQANFSGSVGSVDLRGVNFDSLMYADKILVDEIVLDSVSVSIFKDNTKPVDINRFPEYLGQTILGISKPVLIKDVVATHVDLVYEERKPDGSVAKVLVTKGTAELKNITNLSPDEELLLSASARLADMVQANLTLKFSYSKPQFYFEGGMSTFDLVNLNPIIKAYTPAEFVKGTADEVKFSGIASHKLARGNLKFLYHDMQIDLKLKEQPKWKSSLVTFGANTALLSNNPVSPTSPEREVIFNAERDMNKGFLNLVIRSLLNGMKETMIMSKENRREFNELKRATKREIRQAAKNEKN